ncbi:acyltransferase family protein [Labedella endophytica]|uniref:Acyltransferase n=1 Tax=Labedella endophytica TaxID=1523160 RepID=A0A433JUN8_9MICO|nr:acyltransferase family protein [Labedella endophytica]RUR01886.1 acyltransferase [Labedella endophytica]
MAQDQQAATVFRRDLQGLRALAVVAVVLSHTLGVPAGGYVGVDVFFVLSGFLITEMILRDHARTGRVSLTRFYGRRVRRLLPAAVLVLGVTTAVSFLLLNRPRAESVLGDAVASALFVSNWRFAATDTDYFAAGETVSPLQHFWSLSVEEQFTLVWPALVLLVLALVAARSATRARIAVGALAGTVVVASFVFAMLQTAASPEAAYFATGARVWELGIGAVLAASSPAILRMPAVARGAAGWLGVGVIVAACLLLTADSAFPGPWALAPTLGAALVIAGGMGGASRSLVVLTNPLSVGIGNISYALYLWHFPVVVLLPIVLPDTVAAPQAVLLAATLALALISYALVEQPIHRSPWLERPRTPRAERRDAWTEWRGRFGSQFVMAGLCAVIVGSLGGIVVSPQLQSVGTTTASVTAGDDTEALAVVQGEIAAATTATAWPELSPSLDDVISRSTSDNPARDCFQPGDMPDVGRCSWGSGDAPKRMFVIGDSTALAYSPAFRAIADQSGGQWRITTIGLYGCRFTDVLLEGDGDGVMESCEGRKQGIAEMIAAEQPDMVVIAEAFVGGHTTSGQDLSPGEIVDATARYAAGLGVGDRVTYLAPPPLGADLGSCYTQVSAPADCAVRVDDTWRAFDAAGAATAGAGAWTYVSSIPFSCAGDVCPAFAGSLPTKFDQVHLTTAFSEHIAPALRRLLADAGLL